MQFGVMVATRISDWQLLAFAEQHGYDAAWVPDSQMIWSDCYAVLALAAANTTRIRLGTGVAIAGTRIAPVTAHSIASINQLAPGRVFLGIGTGHTAMRVMGMDPVKAKEFREYLRVVRGLLAGEEVEYTLRGQTRPIALLHRGMGFFDVEHRIPIYVAANGPLALKAAGAYGDGRISAGSEPQAVFAMSLAAARAGAEAAGRAFPAEFHTAALTSACVLRPGETLASERVIDEVGAMVTASLHFWWELAKEYGSDEFIRAEVRDDWERYQAFIAGLGIREDRLHLRLHEGHCTFLHPDERRFVTPALIRASGGLVGTPDEIIARLREHERGGLREVTLLPPMDVARQNLADFATHVIARY